jgi:hypothetical protein
MIRRTASPKLIAALHRSSFWKNIASDTELQPEIRDEKITVYYQAAALLRELTLNNGTLTAAVRDTYVPVIREGRDRILHAVDGKLEFADAPAASPIGIADEATIGGYKSQVEADQGPASEGTIVQAICTDPRNMIIDQEIAFQEASDDRDKIDLCCIDPNSKKLVFVEVKRLGDDRLKAKSEEGRREVINQLAAYGSRIQNNHAELIQTYREVLRIKRDLDLGGRYPNFLPEHIAGLEERPILVIGHCSRTEVQQVLNGQGEWKGFVDALRPVASALILCGSSGCAISLATGRQKQVFPRADPRRV